MPKLDIIDNLVKNSLIKLSLVTLISYFSETFQWNVFNINLIKNLIYSPKLMAGFLVKNPLGINLKPKRWVGITGQSSGRGI